MDCRILPHEDRDGPDNMAMDEALLDAVDADPSAAVLRTYGWSIPTLSLGYFQAIEDLVPERRWDGRAIVRRPSGGGALWHHHEVTYSLVVPRSHPLAGRPSNLYRAVHAAIAEALRSSGIAADRRGEGEGNPRSPRPLLCFLDRDPEDILVDGGKIVGSAQRRRPAAVLQHGSLLLRGSDRTPELPGLSELSGEGPGADFWANALGLFLPKALGLVPRRDGLRPSEIRAMDRLSAEVYRSPDWTERRRKPTTNRFRGPGGSASPISRGRETPRPDGP